MKGYDKTIARNYFFDDFSNEELEILCNYSNSQMFYYSNIIENRKQDIDGLFYEISQVYGNWNAKDRILPGLFTELVDILKNIIKKIQEFEKDSPFDNYSIQSSYHRDKLRRINLLKYLTRLFKNRFINYGYNNLSETYTHRSLKKEVRKIDIRINNVLEQHSEYTIEQCNDYAKEGLKNLIMRKLKQETLPLVSTPKKLANLFHDEYENRDLLKKIKDCFRPSIGNSEYHLGLIPIWEDIPGRGISAYFFDYNNEKLVLIVNHAKPPLFANDGNPYAQTGTTIIDLFREAEAEDNFLEWFKSDEVKEKLARHLLFTIIFKFLKNKEALTEEILAKSSEYAKERLKLLEQYYGVSYDFEEITSLIKEREIMCIQEYNLIQEEKERQINIINQLFPIKILLEESGI